MQAATAAVAEQLGLRLHVMRTLDARLMSGREATAVIAATGAWCVVGDRAVWR
jgi:hypothetical protein